MFTMLKSKSTLLTSLIIALVFCGIYEYTQPNVANAEGGYTWSERTGSGSRPWSHIEYSADGTKLIGSVYGDSIVSENNYMYMSVDGGETWSPLTAAGARDWYWLSASPDFTHILGSDYGGYLYLSSDSGVTWNALTGAGAGNWWPSVISTDGTKIVAGNGTDLYYSSDSGTTWATSSTALVGATTYIDASPDLSFMAAAHGASKRMFTSSDYGVTWTSQAGSDQNGRSGYGYSGLTISDDGTRIAASTYLGRMYLSNDSGVTFSTSTSAAGIEGRGMAGSADGRIVAGPGHMQNVYISTDFGDNWITQTSAGARHWYSIGSSDSGLKMAASVYNGYIWTAQAPDSSAPQISSIATSTTQTSATISWVTDKIATSTVNYGTTDSYGSASSSDSFKNIHSTTLTNLTPGTTYNFQIQIAGEVGDIATSSDLTFTTSAPAVVVTTPTPSNLATPTAVSVPTLSQAEIQKIFGNSSAPTTTPTPSPTVCTAGALFNTQTGQPCTTTTVTTVVTSPTNTPYTFTRNLTLRSTGADVQQLQQYLNRTGYTVSTTGPGSRGAETTYFGKATQRALINFQKAKLITPAVGFFGPVTRGVINSK